MLIPHICCAIITVKDANVARLCRVRLVSEPRKDVIECSLPDTWDSKELDKASRVIGLLDQFLFHSDLSIDVVEITRCLELGVSEALERLVSPLVHSFLDVPSWGLCCIVSNCQRREREMAYLDRSKRQTTTALPE